jgi:hypothetical protein
MKPIRFGLAVACLAALPLRAQAQNNTAGTAARVAPNVTLLAITDDGANSLRWYRFAVMPNRSYCVETSQGEFLAANTAHENDSILDTYSDEAGTVFAGSNDDNGVEPTHGVDDFGPSRVCEIVATSGVRLVRLSDHSVGAQQWKLKINDTTLFAPWFFSGGGFESFVLVKNTTSTATTVRIALYNTSGTFLASASGTAPANGNYNLQVSSIFGSGSFAGGVAIAHNAAPGGVVASVTSLNFASGVSFDTQASPRQDWRQ